MPSGPIPARIMIVGEAPGSEEERVGAPFMGASGNELTKMLREAGINRNECFITNVIRIRPPGNDLGAFIAFDKKSITPAHQFYRDRKVLRCVIEGVELLKHEVEQCRPNVIIALGNCALWALTGRWGIMDYRGSVLESDLVPGVKVVAAYHPAAILRQWSWRPALVHDLRRAARESLSREINRPSHTFHLRPSFSTTTSILDALLAYAENLRSPSELPARNNHGLSAWLLDMERGKKLYWLPHPPTLEQTKASPRVPGYMDGCERNPPLTGNKVEALLPQQTVLEPLSHNSDPSLPRTDVRNPSEIPLGPCNPGPAPSAGLLPPSEYLPLVIDIETRMSAITCIGLAWSSQEALVIPLTTSDTGDGHYWQADEEAYIIWQLSRLLTHPRVSIIGQNLLYDSQYILKQWGFIPRVAADTMLSQHTMFPGTPKALDYLASLYCSHYTQWKGVSRELFSEKQDV